jgi:hypothetical protein
MAAHISRPNLERRALGDFSVSLAFLTCTDDENGETRLKVYTMREMKYSDKVVRNCQGGWAKETDQDIFEAGAREAFEEIVPIAVSECDWIQLVSNKLRHSYETHSDNLSIEIAYRSVRWKGQNSLKPHISMRIILPTDDHLLESLVAKPVGCSGENGLERTEDLRWDDFSHVKSCSEFLPFTFEVDDIDLVRHCFKSQVRFVDKRTSLDNHKHLHGAGDKIIHCKGNGCTNEIIFSVEQQQDYQKKGWVEPKYCKACKLQRK